MALIVVAEQFTCICLSHICILVSFCG